MKALRYLIPLVGVLGWAGVSGLKFWAKERVREGLLSPCLRSKCREVDEYFEQCFDKSFSPTRRGPSGWAIVDRDDLLRCLQLEDHRHFRFDDETGGVKIQTRVTDEF